MMRITSYVGSVPNGDGVLKLQFYLQVHRAVVKPLGEIVAVKKMNLESLNCDLVSLPMKLERCYGITFCNKYFTIPIAG